MNRAISLKNIDYHQILKKSGIYLLFILFFIISSVLKPDVFPTTNNLISIMVQISMTIILACGECSLILAGSVDLSAGSLVALTGTVMVGIYNKTGSIPLALGVAVIIGALVGMLNGYIVGTYHLPAFIVTLGSQILVRGLALVYANGMPIQVEGDTFRILGQGELFGVIPYPIIVCILVVAFSVVLVSHTPFGRSLYAIGGNIEAARASGINTCRVFILSHVYMGILAAITGYILMSRTNVGQPSAALNYETDAVIGTILGGTSFAGGIGTIGGAVVGCMVMGVLANIMNLMNVSPNLQYVVKGAIILIAIVIDASSKKLKTK